MSRSYSLSEIRELVRRTAPIWYLHDEDEYLPSSVDWYLERATMVSKDGAQVPLAGGGTEPEDKLVQNSEWPFKGESADYWLEVPEVAWTGNVASARSYVSIRRVEPGFLDVSHWFWYPGNGCGTARMRTLAFDSTVATEERIALTTMGFHVSDWEKITIRVTDDAENRIDSVYFAQHSGGHWLKPDQLEFENGQFSVYASRHGHASYPTPGPHYSAHVKTAPDGYWATLTPSALEFWLRNDCMKGSRKVDCAARHEIVHIQEGEGGIALTAAGDAAADADVPFYGRVERAADGTARLREPKWLNYPYRWGPETEQKITHETMFEALKMAAVPLVIYGVLSMGMMLPILGAVAAVLLPVFIKMGNECGKPGPKVKFADSGVIDKESPPEPDNLFTDAAGGPLKEMVEWVEAAGRDVAEWSSARLGEAGNWTEGAAGSAEGWARDAGSWAEGAGADTGAWFKGAGADVGKWAEEAAESAAEWAESTAGDAGRALDPRRWVP